MKADSDNKYYHSNEYGYVNSSYFYDDFLSFSNNKLSAKSFDKTKIDVYSPENMVCFKTQKNAEIVDEKSFYINNNSLYVKNLDTNTETVIYDNCNHFVIGNQKIAYSDDENVFISDINNYESKIKIPLNNELYYINIIDEKLYLIERVSQNDSASENEYKNLKPYIFYIYDLQTQKAVNSYTVDYVNHLSNIVICQENFYFSDYESGKLYYVDLVNEKFSCISGNEYIYDITSNNNSVYFVAEKTKSDIGRHTVECDENGIWKYDVASGEIAKISDECIVDDLLATENFLYCYRIEYFLPRGFANSWVKGYDIKQIPIL